jgi:hypothetical protein
MKHKLFIILALAACILLAACFAVGWAKNKTKQAERAVPEEMMAALRRADSSKSRNRYLDNSDYLFWENYLIKNTTGELQCVSLYGDETPYTLISQEDLREQIPREQRKDFYRSGYIDNFYFCNGVLFISWGYFDKDYNDDQPSNTALFSMDLQTMETRLLCTVPKCYVWGVEGDSFYYLEQSQLMSEKDHKPLHVRNLRTDEDVRVCVEVTDFGIVDGQLRYVSRQDGAYHVFTYDHQSGNSMLLGVIPDVFGENCRFQFTADRVFMERSGLDAFNMHYPSATAKQLVVFYLADGHSDTFPLPSEIQRLVICERFAYAVLYNTAQYGGSSLTSGIYRIDLSTGDAQKIPHDLTAVTDIWDDDDDAVFITHYDLHGSGGYKAQGVLYRYDCANSQEQLLYWLDAEGTPFKRPAP